jgi:hypothetical protein
MDKPDFTVPESEGLMPNEADYTDWLTLLKPKRQNRPGRALGDGGEFSLGVNEVKPLLDAPQAPGATSAAIHWGF